MSDRLIDRIRAGEWYSVNSRTSLIAEFDAIEQERDTLKEQKGIVENACQDWRERAESAEAEVKTLCTNIGIQTEHISDLELVELKLDDPDSVVKMILDEVVGYIERVL